jgi:hypothetical protein
MCLQAPLTHLPRRCMLHAVWCSGITRACTTAEVSRHDGNLARCVNPLPDGAACGHRSQAALHPACRSGVCKCERGLACSSVADVMAKRRRCRHCSQRGHKPHAPNARGRPATSVTSSDCPRTCSGVSIIQSACFLMYRSRSWCMPALHIAND